MLCQWKTCEHLINQAQQPTWWESKKKINQPSFLTELQWGGFYLALIRGTTETKTLLTHSAPDPVKQTETQLQLIVLLCHQRFKEKGGAAIIGTAPPGQLRSWLSSVSRHVLLQTVISIRITSIAGHSGNNEQCLSSAPAAPERKEER